MATTEIPPARESELHDVPVLVVQLQDDLSRSRLREAFWISVIFHLVLVLLAVTSPKWAPSLRPLQTRSAEELMHDRTLTYLDLPHDRQKVDRRPNTNTISDKDRIASSRHPSIDRKTLQELRDSSRPGPTAPPAPSAAPPSPPAQQQATANGNPPAAMRPQTQARLEQPQPPATRPNNPFAAAMSPGASIEQATRAAAGTRVAGGYGGSDADYGYSRGAPSSSIQSNLDILSDTMGVDFGPYLARVLHDVRINWYNLIPEVARAPLMKKGKVSIEFVIEKDGRVAGMRIVGPSGDISLDRAAWGGITGSNPFPPLPGEFRGPFLALRFHFYYNPAKGELQ
jgi:TonB family protein